MKKIVNKPIYINLLWSFPLIFYAADANAWGLYPHLFFSQWMMLSTPLLGSATLSPKIQQAIKRFPKLVLSGALCHWCVLLNALATTAKSGKQAPANTSLGNLLIAC